MLCSLFVRSLNILLALHSLSEEEVVQKRAGGKRTRDHLHVTRQAPPLPSTWQCSHRRQVRSEACPLALHRAIELLEKRRNVSLLSKIFFVWRVSRVFAHERCVYHYEDCVYPPPPCPTPPHVTPPHPF